MRAADDCLQPRPDARLTITLPVRVRWMTGRDHPAVLTIERKSFDCPWSAAEFLEYLGQPDSIGMVAEIDEFVVGYMVFKLGQKRIELLNLAVAPTCRRRGVGCALIDHLTAKLIQPGANRRQRIVTYVRERNLAAQLFFRALGFRAVRVLRDYYDGCDDDAYRFEYRHG